MGRRALFVGTSMGFAVIVFLAVIVLTRPPLNPPSENRVTAPATVVILTLSDVNQPTSQWYWEELGSGGNASYAWRDLRRTTTAGTVYTYTIILWLESDTNAARARFDTVATSYGIPTNRDTSPYADESACWVWDNGNSERVLNRRWNAVFSIAVTKTGDPFTISCAVARVVGGDQADKIEAAA